MHRRPTSPRPIKLSVPLQSLPLAVSAANALVVNRVDGTAVPSASFLRLLEQAADFSVAPSNWVRFRRMDEGKTSESGCPYVLNDRLALSPAIRAI